MKKFLAIVLIVAVVVITVACGRGNGADGPIRIAVTAPLTGTLAVYGESIRNGAQMAADRANAEGGIDGRMIEIVARDDRADPNEAVSIANAIVADSDILAVVGNFNSSLTLASSPIYNNSGIVQISPGSSSPLVSDTGEYTFRVITTDAVQGLYMATRARDLGLRRLAVIHEQTDFGIGLLNVFNEVSGDLGLEIVAVEAYTSGLTTDFSTILTLVRQAEPDAIVIGGFYNEAVLIVQQSARLGLDVEFLGVDALFSESLISFGGQDVEGFRLMGFFLPGGDNHRATEFAQQYEELHGIRPDTYAAYSYDAMNLIIRALRANGATREAVRPYLESVVDHPGVTGYINFDERGDVLNTPTPIIIRDGRFQVDYD